MKLRNKKTGDIIESEYMMLMQITSTKGERNLLFENLTKLNEEWEDYEPKEPLIKDEKIRKAVRAWAEACFNDNEFWVIDLGERNFTLEADRSDARATFYSDNKIDGIEENRFYTITELCGEEEESEDDEDEEDLRAEEY